MPVSSKVKITKNRKAQRIAEEILCLDGDIQWGLPDLPDVQDYPDGTPVIDVAIYNEFGTATIPASGYFRRSARGRRRQLIRDSKDAAFAVSRGRLDCDKAMDLIGQQAAATLRKDLTDFKDPANAASTIARKGFDNRMIETGHLRSQITHRVVKS